MATFNHGPSRKVAADIARFVNQAQVGDKQVAELKKHRDDAQHERQDDRELDHRLGRGPCPNTAWAVKAESHAARQTSPTSLFET